MCVHLRIHLYSMAVPADRKQNGISVFFSITLLDTLLATLYINYHIIVVLLRINRSICTTDPGVRSTESRLSSHRERTLSHTSINPTILKRTSASLSRNYSPSLVRERARIVQPKKKNKKKREIYGIHRREPARTKINIGNRQSEEIEFPTS